MSKTHDQLRLHVDGNDGFMRGFQIGQAKVYKRKMPRWVNSDAEIRNILLSAFPKLKTDPKQRTAAARWVNVIHYYFRLRYTYIQTAEELALKPKAVRGIIESIKNVSEGRCAKKKNNKLRGGKRGRPKNRGAK